MVKCIDISKKRKKVCVGSLNRKIALYQRDLQVSAFNDVENRQEYNLIANIFASVETKRGIEIFDGVNNEGASGVLSQLNIIFIIRHRNDITSQNFIQFDNLNFKILQVENIDYEKRWMRVFSVEKGDLNLPAAL